MRWGYYFYISRTKVSGSDAASTIYVSTAPGTANNEDFTPIDKLEVNFGKKELQKTITVKTKSDKVNNESEEDFYLLAFKTFDDAENNAADASWQVNKAFIKNVSAASTNILFRVILVLLHQLRKEMM